MISVENVSDDTHGVSLYSVVESMNFYHVEVRASGYELLNPSGNDKLDAEIVESVKQFILKEVRERYE